MQYYKKRHRTLCESL